MSTAESTIPPTSVSAPEVSVSEEQIEELQEGGISLLETVQIALSSLTANKLRTLLTALGIIIGVASVVALMAIGNGSTASITETITANGANLLTVRSGASSSGGARGSVGSAQTLTTDDATALSDPENVPSASLVSPEYTGNGQLVAGSNNTNAQIIGAINAYMEVHNITMSEGDFISADDQSSTSSVVVLGANVSETLFPDGGAVGQSIRISGKSFRVIGVMAEKGGTGFGSTDDAVIIPLSTAQRKLFGGAKKLSSIAVQATSADVVESAISEITLTLREEHNLADDGSEDDFSIVNQSDILDSLTETTQTLTLFLGAIAAISLFVGGIGIMNIMLVSVRERTREIGLRKAIGAREGDIMTQFMVEALTISLAGALIGLVLGIAIALIVNATGLMTAVPTASSALLAVGFAMAIGLFFGIAPARSAARLDPIEALRYD